MNYGTIRTKFSFEAGHHLPKHKGKCSQRHGHSIGLWVEVSGPINRYTGMVIDFSDLKEIVNKLIIDKFDHTYLNDIIPNPTAENLAALIGNTLKAAFEKLGLQFNEVVVSETEGNEAIW